MKELTYQFMLILALLLTIICIILAAYAKNFPAICAWCTVLVHNIKDLINE